MHLSDFDTLTFDCYGTLIDWESGIYRALKPWMEREGLEWGRDGVLEAFARHESRQQIETPSMLYPQLLGKVLEGIANEAGVTCTAEDAKAFGNSVGDWPAFPDSADALSYLEEHYRLVILSNVDRASFARSNEKLGVEFYAVYTAEEIGTYKPNPMNFEHMLARLAKRGTDKDHILHTAQSLHHDHVPAKAFGLASAWIDRRGGGESWGATLAPPGEPRYDFRFESMAELVEAHRAESAGAR